MINVQLNHLAKTTEPKESTKLCQFTLEQDGSHVE